jgi:hypothetical protein
MVRATCIMEDEKKTLRLARWIVERWGGIRGRTKEGNFERAIADAEQAHSAGKGFRMESVASWSKYLAFRYPHKRAIYDARVAYALNWLLFQCRAERFFPFPEGRNSSLQALNYEVWAAHQRHGDAVLSYFDEDIEAKKSRFRRTLRANMWLDAAFAYQDYCHLLRKTADMAYVGDDWGLTKVEMALFAMAPGPIARDVFNVMIRGEKKSQWADGVSRKS